MKRVYLVDDSILVRERLTDMLSSLEGVRVIGQTGDPMRAEVEILEMQPDVAILDIQLPGMSGIELLRQIKRMRPTIQVIMLTSYAYPQYEKECLEAGADFFLAKVEDLDRLGPILGELKKPPGEESIRGSPNVKKPP